MTSSKDKTKMGQLNNHNKVAVKTTKKRFWLILLFLGVVLTTVVVLWVTTRETGIAATGSGTYTAQRGDLVVTVTEGGSVRAHKSIQYKCQVESRGTSVSIVDIVPDGTYISQEDVDTGKILVKLDSSALEDQLIQEEMELGSDQESAVAAKESYEIQLIQNESDIADGQLTVRFALLDLQKYLGAELAEKLRRDVNEAVNLSEYVAPFVKEVGVDPNILTGTKAWQEIKDLQDQIVLAEGNLKTAQDTYEGTVKLHDANYVSDLELERDKLSVTNSQFKAKSSIVDLDLFMRYDFPKNTEQYLSNYIEAGRQLERTYAQCRSREAQAKVSLSMAEQRYQRQSDRVKELKQQIAYCTIKAKAPGLVVYGTGDSGDAFRAMRGRGGSGSGIIAEGETVYEGQTIISMPDTATMVAEISVHETEVDKVRPGQPATIIMDAFPDKVLQGQVLEVASLPDQQRGWMNPDLKVYQSLVKINGSHDFLKTRMSCKVRILVDHLEDVIIVPMQVIANRSGKKVCYVNTPQGAVERTVVTGAFNDTLVQIMEGLEEGEEVLLNPVVTEYDGLGAFQQVPDQIQTMKDLSQTTDAGVEGEQSGRRMGRGADGQGQRSRGQGQMSDEDRQRIRERINEIRGQMTEEQIQQLREQFGGQRGEGTRGGFNLSEEQMKQLREKFGSGGGGGRTGERRGQSEQ